MIKEVIVTGSTIDEATAKAAFELGVTVEQCTIEVLESPKKGLFGKIKGVAKIKATIEIPDEIQIEDVCNKKLDIAKDYLRNILDSMGLNEINLILKENNGGAIVTFDGPGMAVLIGHHGETLDALQYLIALTCNRIDGDYYRISLDCGDYRKKREATLESLANRISEKVIKTGRSQFLEAMNPYERRIIHAVVSEITGVTSKSRGDEPNRKVVIMSTVSDKPPVTFRKNTNRKEDCVKVPLTPYKSERSMEEILKNDFKEKEESAELFSKLEL